MDNTYDKMYYPEGRFIGGVDESGVVDIAGPIVAACVILPKITPGKSDLRIFEIDDSKNIAEKYRESHAEIIWQTAIAIGIGEVTPSEIDYLGKRLSCDLAMVRAVEACSRISNSKKTPPDFLLVDGTHPIHIGIKQHPVKDADKKSLCVAAASLVAKVYRDGIMCKLHERYPHYDWNHNKGYPCEKHFSGIDRHGVVLGVHRSKLWPFMFNSKYPENVSFWKERRRRWRKLTLERNIKELGPDVWRSKIELWKPSITYKNLQSHEVKIGMRLKKRKRRLGKRRTKRNSMESTVCSEKP